MGLRHSHTYGHGHTRAQRSRGRLHAGGKSVFRMSRGLCPPLAEIHQVFLRQAVAEQVQQRIQHHGAVSAREHKPVTVFPVRICRIVVHVMGPELERCRRRTQRKAGMSGICLLNGICRKNTYRIYCKIICLSHNILLRFFIHVPSLPETFFISAALHARCLLRLQSVN